MINKIELTGIVGRVNITALGDATVARLSLATDYAYKSHDDYAVIDTTWFSVTAWDGPKTRDILNLHKGTKIHLIGRMRMRHIVDVDGCERQSWEVVANELQIIED